MSSGREKDFFTTRKKYTYPPTAVRLRYRQNLFSRVGPRDNRILVVTPLPRYRARPGCEDSGPLGGDVTTLNGKPNTSLILKTIALRRNSLDIYTDDSGCEPLRDFVKQTLSRGLTPASVKLYK